MDHPVVAADEEIVKQMPRRCDEQPIIAHLLDRVAELEAQVAELMKENASLKTHEALTDATIKPAADDWCKGGESREAVKRRFGPIEEWDVSQVTNMGKLFRNQWMAI